MVELGVVRNLPGLPGDQFLGDAVESGRLLRHPSVGEEPEHGAAQLLLPVLERAAGCHRSALERGAAHTLRRVTRDETAGVALEVGYALLAIEEFVVVAGEHCVR